MEYFPFTIILLFFSIFNSVNSIIVLPFKINSYAPKKEGELNVTDLINEYLIHDMFTTIEIGSGSSIQKVTTLITPEDSVLALSSNVCKRKSLDNINDLSIVSKKGLNIFGYNSDFNTKNFSDYLDDEKNIGIIKDFITMFNSTYLSSQPNEKNNKFEKDSKMIINNVSIAIKDKKYNSNENLCCILGTGSPLQLIDTKLKDNPQFINFLKENKIIKDYSWTFKFHTKTEGRLIIGDKPHNYESNTTFYNKKKFIKTETFSPRIEESHLHWSFDFKEIFFINSKNETIYVGKWIKMILMSNIGFIISEDKYKNLILENYFKELIGKSICVLEKTNITKFNSKEITFGTTGIYEVFHCDKEGLNKEKKLFPELTFFEPNLNYNFTFTFNNLFELVGDRYYFLIIFPEDLTHPYYKVWYIGLPFYYNYQCVFNYDSKTIGFYDQNIIIDDKDSENDDDKKEENENNDGDKKKSGDAQKNNNKNIWSIVIQIIVVIILIILIIVAYFIGKKVNEKRNKRANELNENYDYISGNGENINETEDNLINSDKNEKKTELVF